MFVRSGALFHYKSAYLFGLLQKIWSSTWMCSLRLRRELATCAVKVKPLSSVECDLTVIPLNKIKACLFGLLQKYGRAHGCARLGCLSIHKS